MLEKKKIIIIIIIRLNVLAWNNNKLPFGENFKENNAISARLSARLSVTDLQVDVIAQQVGNFFAVNTLLKLQNKNRSATNII